MKRSNVDQLAKPLVSMPVSNLCAFADSSSATLKSGWNSGSPPEIVMPPPDVS